MLELIYFLVILLQNEYEVMMKKRREIHYHLFINVPDFFEREYKRFISSNFESVSAKNRSLFSFLGLFGSHFIWNRYLPNLLNNISFDGEVHIFCSYLFHIVEMLKQQLFSFLFRSKTRVTVAKWKYRR